MAVAYEDASEEVVPLDEVGKDEWGGCDTSRTEMSKGGWGTRGCILSSPILPRVWQGEC